MNFGAVDGVSLRSGYALPACHPVNGGFYQSADAPLIKAETVSRQSRPALLICLRLIRST